jgi:hypothetical protein
VPCTAFEPYSAEAGPRITSIALASSDNISKGSLTLQKPVGRMAMLSSRNRKLPQEPGPVSAGERIAVMLSWPLPRVIQVPGQLCTGFVYMCGVQQLDPLRIEAGGVAGQFECRDRPAGGGDEDFFRRAATRSLCSNG